MCVDLPGEGRTDPHSTTCSHSFAALQQSDPNSPIPNPDPFSSTPLRLASKKRALKEAKFTQSRDAKPQGKRSQLEQNFPHADGKQRQHCSSSRKSDKSQTQIQ